MNHVVILHRVVSGWCYDVSEPHNTVTLVQTFVKKKSLLVRMFEKPYIMVPNYKLKEMLRSVSNLNNKNILSAII